MTLFHLHFTRLLLLCRPPFLLPFHQSNIPLPCYHSPPCPLSFVCALLSCPPGCKRQLPTVQDPAGWTAGVEFGALENRSGVLAYKPRACWSDGARLLPLQNDGKAEARSLASTCRPRQTLLPPRSSRAVMPAVVLQSRSRSDATRASCLSAS